MDVPTEAAIPAIAGVERVESEDPLAGGAGSAVAEDDAELETLVVGDPEAPVIVAPVVVVPSPVVVG